MASPSRLKVSDYSFVLCWGGNNLGAIWEHFVGLVGRHRHLDSLGVEEQGVTGQGYSAILRSVSWFQL